MNVSHEISLCGAAQGCPLQLADITSIAQKIENLISESKWPEIYLSKSKGEELYHSKIKVSISACPNACSEPQIRDIGLIAQKEPKLFPDYCKKCGKCEKVCQEDAITVKKDYGPVFNDNCVFCGQCIAICPFNALLEGRTGYQLLIGGKLGRHPQLAFKIDDFQSEDEIIEKISKILDFVISSSTGITIPRLGDLLTPSVIKNWKK